MIDLAESWAKLTRPVILVELAAVAVIAVLALGFGIQGAGLGSGYVDPFLHARAQDEAVYAHAAARMVHTGHWLTPVFLNRFMLNKPPLLMWSGALSMRVLGVSPLALRISPIVAGVFCCLLIYCWLRRSQPLLAALSGVFLLLADPLFHSMARKFMTDIILTALVTAAMFSIALDPSLKRAASAVVLGVLCGAAILTKSAAGLLPLLILIIYFFLTRAELRPAANRVLLAGGAAALIAAPWHLYQWLAHRDWFMAEYIRFQLLGSGITAPSRYSGESNLSFYAQRLLSMDPLLVVLWALALWGVASAWKRVSEESEVRLLAAWCIGSFAVLLAFGTRVAYYLLPLIPAMALMSVRFSPLFRGRWAPAMCGLLVVAFGIKAAQGDAAWGLDYQRETVPSAAALENYSELRRANELVIVSPVDEFYSSTLDLPKLRYVYLGTLDRTKTSGFFYWLGVNLSTHDFCNLPALLPNFQQRLSSWHDPNPGAVGAIILGEANADVSEIIRCSPDRDFFLPDELRNFALSSGSMTHFATQPADGRFFFLAKNSTRRPSSAHGSGAMTADLLCPRAYGVARGSKPIELTTAPSSRASVFSVFTALSK